MFRLSTVGVLLPVLLAASAAGQDATDGNVAERAAAAAREKLVQRQLDIQAKQIAELKVELARARKEAELTKRQAEEEIAAGRKARQEVLKALDQARAMHEKFRDETGRSIEELREKLDEAAAANRRLAERVADADGWGTRASDGKLAAFDAETGIGRVPFGSEDGVVPKLRFLVGSPPGAAATAVVSVTRILGPHASEVKLLVEPPDPEDLPRKGADLYAAWWRPGIRTHFAIAGRLDLDGDGRADNRAVTEFLASQGGIVDLHVNGEGFAFGEPTDDIRFLILGEVDDPILVGREDRERAERLLRTVRDVREHTDRLGVHTIRLEEFVRMSGGPPSPPTEEERAAEIRRLIEKLEQDRKRRTGKDEFENPFAPDREKAPKDDNPFD